MHCYYSTVILVGKYAMCYVLSYYSPLKSVINFLIPRVNLMTCRRDSPRLDVRGKSAPAVYNQTFFHYRGVTSSSELDMQCQENGRRTMSRSAQILRGLFGFKVKSLYKNSLGSSVDYQGYCFGVFGQYSINTVPGPQAELARLPPPSHSDDLETI